MSEQEQTIDNSQENLEAKIIARAWKSDAYKQELLENTKAVIAREFDVELPAEMNVQILEETPTNLYFVIPVCPSISAADLAAISEEELAQVAGGKNGTIEISKGIFSGLFSVSVDQFRRYSQRNQKPKP
ncbi:NHLP leader peptide family natural product precursor [Calothrix sp. FACHB-1219]|uniref:NHLP leader peptide family RiPP precursor n=1 Tax=unclassified Calothrix TaxID=2619626 RepID=UPI0016823DB2|nr:MULTISPECIES: NHLP leader peptide family RiPP precursor [unclassified Calothrix]MBD2207947.1 NHLP leader peptide family natural product precursor [Calothrix sp. FACHB-168]MBD2222499.1 NHLP leader peptide family natural product precursor [Calothrix sp. FACHB-1219]